MAPYVGHDDGTCHQVDARYLPPVNELRYMLPCIPAGNFSGSFVDLPGHQAQCNHVCHGSGPARSKKCPETPLSRATGTRVTCKEPAQVHCREQAIRERPGTRPCNASLLCQSLIVIREKIPALTHEYSHET